MNLARFNAILEAYGAMPDRWPAHERADALILARSSVVAARELARARALDDALAASAFPDIAAEPGRLTVLHARIVSSPQTISPSWFRRWLGFDLAPAQLWPSVAGLALASVLGFAVGISGLMQSDISRDSDEIMALPSIDMPSGDR